MTLYTLTLKATYVSVISETRYSGRVCVIDNAVLDLYYDLFIKLQLQCILGPYVSAVKLPFTLSWTFHNFLFKLLFAQTSF